ncbi:hypothetical protein MMC31_001297 [Peltigera leucophlebia]|nr:hypothetical protein [Peltigera leucophlebia]
MAPPITVVDQNRFLIACIKNSNHGKVDFSKVAEECNIVTKSAAAKRYERVLKAQSESSTNPSTSSVPSTPPKTPLKNLPKTPPKTPSKNGISKLASKRAAKTSLGAKMKKKLEEEECLNDAITHEASAKKEPDALRLETIPRFS